MLTFHELIGFMSPGMATRILDDTQANNREVYRALVASMAQAQKMRPVFIGRQPKERRHKNFVQMLSRSGAEEQASASVTASGSPSGTATAMIVIVVMAVVMMFLWDRNRLSLNRPL